MSFFLRLVVVSTLRSTSVARYGPGRTGGWGQTHLRSREVDLPSEEDPSPEKSGQYASLLTWLDETLDEVQDVRLTTRLTNSQACLVSDAEGITPDLEKMYETMGQAVSPVKRILELNPEHPWVSGLNPAYEQRAADPDLT